jgi:hypothetical protein
VAPSNPRVDGVDCGGRGFSPAPETAAPGVRAIENAVEMGTGYYCHSSVEVERANQERPLLYPVIDSPLSDVCPWPTDVREMQLAHLEGWELVFADDFDTDIAPGQFPGPYSQRWYSYHGFADTSGFGEYDHNIISVHNSALDLHMKTTNGRALGAAPIPLVGGQWGGQVYGRFSVRLRADPVPGFGMASLLWSDREIWAEGEVNFPEGDLDGSPNAFNHCLGAPQYTCYEANTDVSFAQWHTYTIEWTPGLLEFYLDDELIGSTTENVPIESLHWVIQAGTNDALPDPAAEGHIMIDWATIHTYTPQRG